ncbi:MAG: hypothetical protein LM593_01020 [Candidatus Verstraetearchaeota archaeon]|jgi:DNA replication factor GINS|nr:hypothetical protein [Candidatus Verstraetearchaeota archaeon]
MYKKLIEIWLNEKKSKELQEISQSFLEELRNYLEKLKEDKESLRKLNEVEIKRVRLLLEKIIKIRKEKKALKSIESITDVFDEFILLLEKKTESPKRILVRILQDVSSFIGIDGRTYGPYKAEDVVSLPLQNAEVLIKRGVAIPIEGRFE